MYPDLRERLLAALDPSPAPVPASGDRLAAVLAPLVMAPEPALVFTQRSDELPRHAGEISFPGGMTEPGDVGLEATALREAHEEIGLDPSLPEVLGALPPVHTFVSAILVVPFVGMLTEPPALTIDEGEITRVLTVSLRDLQAAEREVEWERPGGGTWKGWVYEVDGATIWGATGKMLHDLLEIIHGENR